MADGRFTYQSLLAETDAEARDEYTYDPRVQFFAERDYQQELEAIGTSSNVYENIESISETIVDDDLPNPVQSQPVMREKKRIIIIDSAMRDWTIQPNAYSNIFTFGTRGFQEYTSAQVPYYFNNPTIPFQAYETPLSLLNTGVIPGGQGDIPDIQNNRPQTFPPGVRVPDYLYDKTSNLIQPTYGWKIVLSGGTAIHTPTPFNYTDPNIQVFFYPTYDSRNTRGAQVGTDIQPKRYGLNGYSFYTETQISNITGIRLVRSLLPVAALQPYKPTAFSPQLVYPENLLNKPYLFMSIDSIQGGYYGGAGTSVQKAFTTLVQTDRTLYDGNTTYPGQYADYHSWQEEGYTFDPPISKLSNANIRVYTSLDQYLSQDDNLNIISMFILNGSDLGKIKFFVTQNISNASSFNVSNTFMKNQLRVGDEMMFYTPTITQVQSDPSSTENLRNVFSMLSNDFLVTDICDSDFPVTGILPVAQYGTSFTAVPKLNGTLDNMISVYNTLSLAVQNISQICLQRYSQPRTFSKDYVIPVMNVNLQPKYAFEITCLEPDTTKLQKIIPN